MENMIFTHDIKLSGDDRFTQRFNEVSDMWQLAKEEGITEEERKRRIDNWFSAKYCLEQGIGV